ncbi:kinesin-like protein KIN-7E, chloroplastic isoform X2 [Cryptomeria japonica]|uniref:kinesin-like protein KIN-7E, chloroplastic isoform X2 n=1 Tax=Cryptomeria japonica TaxID=3369 RepID=UPI0027DA526F|nr:kinesin-like protein KIN-7E, chloroplastic isoform X2 [Cryptomeria japonica]
MASKGNSSSKYRKTSPLIPKSPTSPASSTASSYLSSSMGFGSTSKSAGRSTPTTPGSARNLPPFAIQSKSLQPYAYAESLASADFQKSKENVTVTVRFRPLNSREIQKGDEIAWYADGDTTVRNEYNPMTAYAFGTVFAYGVTSSGKTHTMHGDQKSPGIIPLAVKDVFSIIQDTPGREFLLHVSYLEIYNEVINDLLDPAGQNLRIREDAQGTYVEAIKEEVVLSPAHALSLIAAGEEHRHVGSNNFNLLSSRSHTIFTLTIESSPCGENRGDEDVTLSQLNLIDLAGSESSKTETTGLRRKEGSYINKSLLTLGTVISKLTDGKATHVPYRDSKLTRLLQSSLSGHGRVSLICTVTPASSSTEETHNTLKFAHRTKHVEIQAAQNKIIDEKSLIKKYQKEIQNLKQELDQLKRGMTEKHYLVAPGQDDLVTLKQQLKAGQVKLQSRLEEEEQEKAALMGRIQRLTKLILVSTKNTIPSNFPERSGHRRRHSFGEEELAYLPDRRRDLLIDDEDSHDSEFSMEGKGDNNPMEETIKDKKKNRKHGMLNWFKLRKQEIGGISTNIDNESSPTASSVSGTTSSLNADSPVDSKTGRRKSVSLRVDDVAPVIDSFNERTQAGDLFSATVRGRRPPPTGTTMADQMDLLREQVKMLAGEVALCTSSLKRLSEQAASNPDDFQLQVQMQSMKDEIEEKKRQMQVLEKRMLGSIESSPNTANILEMSQCISKLTAQLNEKTFELEIKTADNRVLQEQLQTRVLELNEMQETVLLLRQQLNAAMEKKSLDESQSATPYNTGGWLNTCSLSGELRHVENSLDVKRPDSTNQLPRGSLIVEEDISLQSQVLMQAAEIEKLKQDKVRLIEEKDGLEVHSQKLAEESAYAKELASAAAVELKALAEEVTKLSYQNAKLTSDLEAAQESTFRRAANGSKYGQNDETQDIYTGGRREGHMRKFDQGTVLSDIRRDLIASHEREAALEAALIEKEQKETELQKKIEEAKQREADLENDLANMWVVVAKLKKGRENPDEVTLGLNAGEGSTPRSIVNDNIVAHSVERSNNYDEKRLDQTTESRGTVEELKISLDNERQKRVELESLISQLKSEDIDGLDLPTLDDLQSLHVDAITKICHAKVRMQEKSEKEGFRASKVESYDESNSSFCKVCFAAQTAAVVLPCRHLCLCKTCAVACTECPVCNNVITDRVITYKS